MKDTNSFCTGNQKKILQTEVKNSESWYEKAENTELRNLNAIFFSSFLEIQNAGFEDFTLH
jgi:hypothetical protein